MILEFKNLITMKKISLLFTIIFVALTSINAQTDNSDDIETLFQKPSKIRGYVGPLTNYTLLDGETAYMSGVHAAGIFNDHFVLGFYKLDMENNIWSNNDNYIGSTIDFDHKGLWLGYIFMPKKVVHFTTNVQLGKGNLEIYNNLIDTWIEDDMVFVITPSIEAEFNIAKFLRIGVGANYQFALDVDKFMNYTDDDFSDFGAFVTFKFGWFK